MLLTTAYHIYRYLKIRGRHYY